MEVLFLFPEIDDAPHEDSQAKLKPALRNRSLVREFSPAYRRSKILKALPAAFSHFPLSNPFVFALTSHLNLGKPLPPISPFNFGIDTSRAFFSFPAQSRTSAMANKHGLAEIPAIS